MNYKLGSLFDGSGGFPLAGVLCGIEPVWAAEIEPYPIAVTRSRFPKMQHLGDISKINGAEIEPVDIITFGSPCQDLSVAGKRAGLKHTENGDDETTRSGLFMEAVRIIKEMRNATNGQYPTFALWENVPGAFSSNKGEDFKVVCEELIKIVEPSAVMPAVPPKGWNYADSFVGDGWSLAYRVLDAQYWGVPQRRRRIYLVADFGGQRAREVLFEREGLRGYFTQGRTPWQTAPADAQGGTGADDCEGDGKDRGRQLDAVGTDFYNQALTGDKAATLSANSCMTATRNGPAVLQEIPYTLKIRSGCEGGGKGALIQKDKSATLATSNDQYLFQPMDPTFIIDNIGGQAEYGKVTQVNGTLRSGCQGAIGYVVESPNEGPVAFEWHNQDTRIRGPIETACTLNTNANGREGHLVMEPFCKSARAQTADDATTWKHGKVANTLNTFDQGEARANELVVEEKPVICLQGNGIDRADTAGCNGKGWKEDKSYTLNTIDRPAVAYQEPETPCYSIDEKCGTTYTWENQANTLAARDYKQPQAVAFGIDPGASRDVGDLFIEEQSKTLTNGSCPGHHNGVVISKQPHYIVRRLTPTECARLQGFADRWGDVDAKKHFTDEEHRFWLEVRNTHARINGKKEQDYTAKQMLTWYNKLQTDSSEYKMWGNGIALPTALYVLQGITDALTATEDELEDWML